MLTRAPAAPASGAPDPRTAVAGGRRWSGAALGLLLAWWLLLSALALARHAAYASGRQDLEIYLQTLWGSAQGRPFATTLLKSNELHLAEHLALSLLPLVPLYGLIPSAGLLLALQQAALALAGLPVWLAARRLLGPRAALLVLAGFLAMPALAGVALDDFHPVAFTAAPLAAAGWLLLRGPWRAGLLVGLLAILLEEEAALVIVGLGLTLLVGRRWRPGGTVAALGATLLLIATLLVMPGFHHPATVRAANGNRALNHFADLRADPAVGLRRLIGDRGLDLGLSYLLPTGGLALLAPGVALAGAPNAGALFLQDRAETFHRHWAAPALPLLWLAAGLGLARLTGRARRVGLGALVVGSTTAYLVAGPLPGGGRFEPDNLQRGPRVQELEQAVRSVPSSAILAASANVAAHLANRPELYVYPIDDHYLAGLRFERRPIEAYVLDLQEPDTQRVPPLGRNSPLLADPPYVVWSSGHKVMLLTRELPRPSISSGATFNRRMMLLGYDLDRSGGALQVTLYWQKVRDVFADFDRLAELLGPDGRALARDRNLPLTNTFATEKWKIGQVVIDRFELPAPSAGPARLRLAWLNRDRGTPMPLDAGGDALVVELP